MRPKLLRRLLLFDIFEFRTKLPAREVLARIASFGDPAHSDYNARITEQGFTLYEKPFRHSGGTTVQNSFAPVVRGFVSEEDGLTTVSGLIRMNLLVLIPFAIIYLCGLISLVLFPILHILLHFAFYRPAKKLKQKLEKLLTE